MVRERVRPVVICGPSKTRQSEKDACDINKIMAKYTKTGRLPDLIRQNPLYGDFSKVVDYQQAIDIIQKAKMQFDELSLEVRKRFDYDPAKFLEFAENSQNISEMVKMGLAIEREKEGENKPAEKVNTEKKD